MARLIGNKVNPESGTYTVAMPWYEREDFSQLRQLADDGRDGPADYETWRLRALEVARQHLATGRALQLVVVNPGEFVAWLASRSLPNTAATRRQYVEHLATHTRPPIAQPPELMPCLAEDTQRDFQQDDHRARVRAG